MYISVLARTLRPGATYRDFVEAWYPEFDFSSDESVARGRPRA